MMSIPLPQVFRTVPFRLFLSHVVVAVLTAGSVTVILLAIIWLRAQKPDMLAYRQVAYSYAVMWLAGLPDGGANDPNIDVMPGWTLVVSEQGEVLWSRGDTTCRAGMQIVDCAPEAASPQAHERLFERNGETWADLAEPMVTGQFLIMQRGTITQEPELYYADFIVRGYTAIVGFEVLTRGVMAIPIALLLAWLITRPQVRRLTAITAASRRFASGELAARVDDPRQDDIGRLARQFDDMADALEQNIQALHELARRNAELALQAEQEAIKAERSRISRDLHDAIAQRLFSLSVSTAALPDVIARSAEQGIQQAKNIAEIAQGTLLDLRALLVDLRPNVLAQQGLAQSLHVLFRQWQTVHHIAVEPTLILSGRHIPAAVEDAIYQITQEALSNIARHARASQVVLSLVEGQQRLILSISDDGIGFDSTAPGQSARFGLLSMRERAGMFGGTLSVESEIGRGTTIQASLPIGKDEQG